MQIPGDPADEIRHCFFQVTSHALLFHLHVIFFNFHCQNQFIGYYNIVSLAYVEIGYFSAYKAGYMRKNGPKSRTYMAALQTIAYVAAFNVF